MATSEKRRSASKRSMAGISNHEIVVVALYLSGGKYSHIDTEDLAATANKIAPGRFTWRKYKDQINIENVRAFASDAKKTKNGAYVIGSGKEGWMLTSAGIAFAERYVERLSDVDLSKTRGDARTEAWIRRERQRMLAEDAFRKFVDGLQAEITTKEVDKFFRIDDYLVGDARQARVQRARNYFSSDPDLGEVVEELAKRVGGR